MERDSGHVQVFEHPQFESLRVVCDDDGEPWFVARDVCDVLGLGNASQACRGFDKDEKGITIADTPGGKQQLTTVSEAGFYRLVLKSRKPEARAFQRWVTHEVLPSIRRDGGYMVARVDETPEETMARALIIADKAIRDRDRRIAEQDAEIDEMRPKALFADAVGASDGTCLVGELAKMLRQNGVDIGQNRLFGWMRDNGYLGKSGSNRNVPTQRSVDMGLFRIKETAITHSDGHVTINRTPKVTGRGQRFFIDKLLDVEEVAS